MALLKIQHSSSVMCKICPATLLDRRVNVNLKCLQKSVDDYYDAAASIPHSRLNSIKVPSFLVPIFSRLITNNNNPLANPF